MQREIEGRERQITNHHISLFCSLWAEMEHSGLASTNDAKEESEKYVTIIFTRESPVQTT
jgi:hypothetical protein